jgi:hypothetical protein
MGAKSLRDFVCGGRIKTRDDEWARPTEERQTMKAEQMIMMAVLVSGIPALADTGFDVSRYNSRLAVLGQDRGGIDSRIEAKGATEISSRAAVVQAGQRVVMTHFEPAVAGARYNSKLAVIGRGPEPAFEIAPLVPAKECGPDCREACCAKK